jgi:hypothetical protein
LGNEPFEQVRHAKCTLSRVPLVLETELCAAHELQFRLPFLTEPDEELSLRVFSIYLKCSVGTSFRFKNLLGSTVLKRVDVEAFKEIEG